MIPTEWVAVVESLERGTRASALDWEEQEGSRTVRVSLSGSTIVMRDYVRGRPGVGRADAGPQQGIRIQLLDADGEVVDSFGVLGSEDEGQRLRALYESASRKARGIDVLLNDVAQELQLLRTSARS